MIKILLKLQNLGGKNLEMMTRKDYIGLAKVFNKEFNSKSYDTYDANSLAWGLLNSLCEFLKSDNKRFNEEKC